MQALELHQAAMAPPDDDVALNAGGGARRRGTAHDDGGPGGQVEMSMCANLKARSMYTHAVAKQRACRAHAACMHTAKRSMRVTLKASLLHELKSSDAAAAAAAAMQIQSAAAAAIGFDVAGTAAALKRDKGDPKVLARGMAALGAAMHTAFQAHLQAEGRTEAAAAQLASFFGEPPREEAEGEAAEEGDVDQSAMESALKGEM